MSWQLLLKPHKAHDEHDDIESIFHVMLYFVTMFSGPNATQRTKNLPYFIGVWLYATDLRHIALSKLAICNMPKEDFEEDVLCYVMPYFEPLKACLIDIQQRMDSRQKDDAKLTHDELIAILVHHRDNLPGMKHGPDDNPFETYDELPPELSTLPPQENSPIPGGIEIKPLVADPNAVRMSSHGVGQVGISSLLSTIDVLMTPTPQSSGHEPPAPDPVRLWSGMEESSKIVSSNDEETDDPGMHFLNLGSGNLFQSSVIESQEFMKKYFDGPEDIVAKKLKRMISKARSTYIPRPSYPFVRSQSSLLGTRPIRSRGFFSALLKHGRSTSLEFESAISGESSAYSSARRIMPPSTGSFSEGFSSPYTKSLEEVPASGPSTAPSNRLQRFMPSSGTPGRIRSASIVKGNTSKPGPSRPKSALAKGKNYGT